MQSAAWWLLASTLLIGYPGPDAQDDAPARGPGMPVQLSVSDAVQIALANSYALRIADLDRSIRTHQVEIEEAIFDPVFALSGDYAKFRNATVSTLDVGAIALGGEVITNPIKTQDYGASVTGRSAYGTQYTVALRAGRIDQPLASGSIFGINPQDRFTASVELTQPLLAGRGKEYNRGRVRIATNNVDVSEYDLALAASDFVFEVEVAYWQLVFAHKNFEAKKTGLQAAQENFDNINKASEIGSRSEAEVTVARSQVSLRKVELSESRVLLFNSQDRLLVLLNQQAMSERRKQWREAGEVAHFDAVLLTPTSEPQTDPLVPDRSVSYQAAFSSRPDLLAVDKQLESQEIQSALAKSESLPQLVARGRWEQYGLDDGFDQSFDSLGSGDYYGWTVGLELTLPFKNRAADNRHLQTVKQARQVALQREQLEQDIYAQVDQAIRTLVSLFQRVNDLNARVNDQRALLEDERKKLKLGRTTAYNVSVIENDLIESEAVALRTKVEYEAAKSDYYRVTGTLLAERGVQDALN